MTAINAALPPEKVPSFLELIDTLRDRGVVNDAVQEILRARDSMNQLIDTHNKKLDEIAAKKAELGEMDKALQLRGEGIAAKRKALDGQQRAIDQRNTDSVRRMNEVEKLNTNTAKYKVYLDERSSGLDKREQELNVREQELVKREKEFAAKQSELATELAAFEVRRKKAAATLATLGG